MHLLLAIVWYNVVDVCWLSITSVKNVVGSTSISSLRSIVITICACGRSSPSDWLYRGVIFQQQYRKGTGILFFVSCILPYIVNERLIQTLVLWYKHSLLKLSKLKFPIKI